MTIFDTHRRIGNRLVPVTLTLLFASAGAFAQTSLRFDVKTVSTSFSPAEVRVVAGDSVRWKFGGRHSSTSGTCSASGCTADGIWDSGIKRSGKFTELFSTPGDFPYFCQVHGAMMQGVVHVVAAPAPNAAPLLLSVTQRGAATLSLLGANIGSNATVEINGVAAPTVVRRNDRNLLAKGSALVQMLPIGTPVQIAVRNADGQVSQSISFTRTARPNGGYGGY